MDLSKLLTNKRVLKTLSSQYRASGSDAKAIDKLWSTLLDSTILGHFKFGIPSSGSIDNSMDDFKAALAKRGINGKRVQEKQHRYNGIWATNNLFMESEECIVSFKHFRLSAYYSPGGSPRDPASLSLSFLGILSDCRKEPCQNMDICRIVDTLLDLDSQIGGFKENIWPQMILEIKKQAKVAEMAENTIELMLKSKMMGSGIPYVIDKQKIRVKATFDIGKKTMVEMAISHSNFAKEIDKIIGTVKQLKDFIEKADMQVRIKAITASNSRYTRWQNAGDTQPTD